MLTDGSGRKAHFSWGNHTEHTQAEAQIRASDPQGLGGPCTQPHSAQIFLQNQLVQPQTVFLCWTWHLLNNSELFFLNLILSENICVHLDTLLPSISLLSLMQLSDVLAQILGQIWVSLNRHQLYWCHEACHSQQEKWQLPYHQTSKPPD